MDINEFSGTLGMATDAIKEKILTKDMVDGLDLRFGNAEAYESAIELISQRRGVGDILAEGTKRAAEKIGGGAETYALHMKGMHWPAHSAPPFVMAFSVSTRGGDFLKAIPHLILQSTNNATCKKLFDAEPETMNIYSHAKKGRAVWWHENYKLLIDSLGVCFYLGQTLLTHGRLLPEELAEAYSAATGIDADGKLLMEAAERANQIERAINSLRGHERKHDTFTKRPEQDSWAQGIDLNRPGMLDEYYAYRGLSQRGFLTQERLLNAELPEIVSDLAKKDLIDHCPDSEDYLALDTIVKNPSTIEFNRSLKAMIQNRFKGYIMGKLSKDPLKYREHFKRIGLKKRNRVAK
jgi:aldehyde:ferredoxin oxidoreductase